MSCKTSAQMNTLRDKALKETGDYAEKYHFHKNFFDQN